MLLLRSHLRPANLRHIFLTLKPPSINEEKLRRFRFALRLFLLVTVTQLLVFRALFEILQLFTTDRLVTDDIWEQQLYMSLSSVSVTAFLLLAGIHPKIYDRYFALAFLITLGSTLKNLLIYFANVYEVNSLGTEVYHLCVTSEVVAFIAFSYSIYFFFNLVVVFRPATLIKFLTIAIDYIYFLLSFRAVLLKYIGKKTANSQALEISAFILGAIAVALRIARVNVDYLIAKLDH